MQSHSAVRFIVPLVIGIAACGGGNISGRLGAEVFGDLSNPAAERRDGRTELTAACGQPSANLPIPYSFTRAPYLQRVTDGSAELSWVAPAGTPNSSVTVSATDGTPVANLAASIDSSARTSSGAPQLMAPIGPLAAGTTYCYDIQKGPSISERLAFRTAPAPGTGAPVRFIAFGDSGAGSDQAPLRDQMATVPFDFMIHTGDIAYAGGTRAAFEQNFFAVYADFLKYLPVFPASGNHEYDSEDAAPFREAFVLPENGGPEGIERWYSFDWGDVHFAVLDTERSGPVQAAWLDADLTANKRPWTIVVGHKPPFSSGEHGNDEGFRANFVPIIETHHVPLVLTGHDHDYERTTPQNGVIYVVTGGGGRGVRPMGSSSFTAFGHPVIHYVYVTVVGNELAMHAIDGLGQEFDSLVIRQ